jgi:catechol 2,3-dioxygenase-like lactoylglutathione lyase family enzyme
MTAMDITIHASFLPHTDPDASLAFFRDTLGFEVRNDVGYGGMRWITVGPADQPRHVHRPVSAVRRPRHHRR